MNSTSLSEVQARFLEALFSDKDSTSHLLPQDMPRLAIYRAAVQRNLGDALRAVYPVVERLTGSEFFDFAARRYIGAHPSASGDLHRYGEAFPGFLAGFAPAASLPYLGDVARLEWLWHEAFHAGDHRAADLSQLAEMPAARRAALRIGLQPACRLMCSPYPVLRIWQVNQPGYRGGDQVDLDEGGVRLVVYRDACEVVMAPVGAGEHAFLESAARDADMATALHAALAQEPALDVAAMLQKLVTEGIVVDFDDQTHKAPGGDNHVG